ncbi:MAG: hypothetical protein AAFO93_15355 [Pseudomonadota bacterium]
MIIPRGDAPAWLLQSVLNDSLFLSVTGGAVSFGPRASATPVTITSTMKWLPSTDAFAAARGERGPMRPFQGNWQYPVDGCSFLAVDPRLPCP